MGGHRGHHIWETPDLRVPKGCHGSIDRRSIVLWNIRQDGVAGGRFLRGVPLRGFRPPSPSRRPAAPSGIPPNGTLVSNGTTKASLQVPPAFRLAASLDAESLGAKMLLGSQGTTCKIGFKGFPANPKSRTGRLNWFSIRVGKWGIYKGVSLVQPLFRSPSPTPSPFPHMNKK